MDIPRFSLRTIALVIAFEALIMWFSTLPMSQPNGVPVRRSLDEVLAMVLAFNVCTLVVFITVRESRRYARRNQVGEESRPAEREIETRRGK